MTRKAEEAADNLNKETGRKPEAYFCQCDCNSVQWRVKVD